jgi:hypothetical protein
VTAFVDAFRTALVEQGHPQDRIDWLVGLVTVEGLPEPASFGPRWPRTPDIRMWWPVPDKPDNQIEWTIGARGMTMDTPFCLYGCYWLGRNYRAIAELVWQDALAALGVTE